jgi:hypothetical protein
MSTVPLAGIVGGYGAVGQATVRLLQTWGGVRLRIGGRHPARAEELNQSALGGYGETFALDIYDPASLDRFCAGCQIVVNCAGPSYRVLDRVALAAFAAGANYVDPGGDEPLYARLAGLGLGEQGRVAILTAGMMPGLSGLLPRWLARQGFERVRQLTAYVGGRGRLTPTGAADYLLSLASATSDSLAAWRDGAKVARALEPLTDVELPFFPPGVTAYPFLSAETARLARELGLRDASWYNVFEGGHMLAALGRLQGATTDREDLSAAVSELSQAAELDLFGRDSYQLFVLHMDGDANGCPIRRTVMLRVTDAHALTGTVNALAVLAVLRGEVAAGLHFAAEALDPNLVEYLRSTPAVTSMELTDASPETAVAVEEGEL